MEYDGMTFAVVGSGTNPGSTNAVTRGTSLGLAGAGAGLCDAGGAAFFFGVFGFLFFMRRRGISAQQQQHKSANRDHCQSSKKEPEEPDAVDPDIGRDESPEE